MATVAGTIYLNGCNYQLKYDLIGQSIENNTTTIRLYGVLNVTNSYVSWSRGTASVHTDTQEIGTYYAQGEHLLIYRDYTFTHNADGTLTIGPGYGINTTFVSGNSSALITLPTIPRQATITSAPNFNDEENPTITYSNPAGNSVSLLQACISLNGSTDDVAYRDVPKTGNSYTFELTEAERNILRNATTTSNSRNVQFFLRTIIGSSDLSSIVVRTLTIVNANPTFSNFEFEDINPKTLALTGNSKYNINSYSNIKVTISTSDKALANKGAIMRLYQFNCGNNSPEIGTYSYNDEVSITVNNATSGTYNVYAIDSRKNTTLVTKIADKTLAYEQLYINSGESNVLRNDNQVGTHAILTLKGTFWNDTFGAVTNTIKSVTYQFKKTDSSTWLNGETTITPTVDRNNFSFTGEIASDNQDTSWDLNSSYNIRVTVTDELSSRTINFTLNSAVPTLSMDKEGVGIMCAYDRSLGGGLQVNGERIDIQDVYSTDEVKTNKIWIDGKPIYRKVIHIEEFSNVEIAINSGITNISEVVSFNGSFKRKGNQTPYFYSIDNVFMNEWRINYNTGVINMSSNNQYVIFAYGNLIIEYTKTTD